MGQAFTSIDCVDRILHCDAVIAEVFLYQDSSVVVDLHRREKQRGLRKLGQGFQCSWCWPGWTHNTTVKQRRGS